MPIVNLNTNFIKLWVDPRQDMTLTDEVRTVDQHAGVKHIVWRGQLVGTNPRTCGRMFDY